MMKPSVKQKYRCWGGFLSLRERKRKELSYGEHLDNIGITPISHQQR
jgi:hypothetical protein